MSESIEFTQLQTRMLSSSNVSKNTKYTENLFTVLQTPLKLILKQVTEASFHILFNSSFGSAIK
jgi:hypothetical protein